MKQVLVWEDIETVGFTYCWRGRHQNSNTVFQLQFISNDSYFYVVTVAFIE